MGFSIIVSPLLDASEKGPRTLNKIRRARSCDDNNIIQNGYRVVTHYKQRIFFRRGVEFFRSPIAAAGRCEMSHPSRILYYIDDGRRKASGVVVGAPRSYIIEFTAVWRRRRRRIRFIYRFVAFEMRCYWSFLSRSDHARARGGRHDANVSRVGGKNNYSRIVSRTFLVYDPHRSNNVYRGRACNNIQYLRNSGAVNFWPSWEIKNPPLAERRYCAHI